MARIQINGAKYKIEHFDGKNNFILWQSTIIDMQTTQGLGDALKNDKFIQIKGAKWKSIQKKMVSQIWLALAREIKYNMLSEATFSGI